MAGSETTKYPDHTKGAEVAIDKVCDKVSEEGEEMARGDIPRAVQAVTNLDGVEDRDVVTG